MQQIADWLEKLGMSEYAQRFAENAIDFSVLPDLTDQDLEKTRRRPRCIAARCCARLPNIATSMPRWRLAAAPAAGVRSPTDSRRRPQFRRG